MIWKRSKPTIERVKRIDDDVLRRFVRLGRPVIIQGLMDQTRAQRSWNVEYLDQNISQEYVEVAVSAAPNFTWNPRFGLSTERMTFGSFSKRLRKSDEGREWLYLQDDINRVPTLKRDYELPYPISSYEIARTKMWVSGESIVVPLHYDPVETFHWVIRGSKRFVMFTPGLREYYPNSWRSDAPFISQVDAHHPDYNQFPEFRKANPVHLDLYEGEVLYIPSFWWHQVSSLEKLNISLNFVWFCSLSKNIRFFRNISRCGRHILRQKRRARILKKQLAA